MSYWEDKNLHKRITAINLVTSHFSGLVSLLGLLRLPSLNNSINNYNKQDTFVDHRLADYLYKKEIRLCRKLLNAFPILVKGMI